MLIQEIKDGRFRPGQVWTYRARPGEEGSRIVVGRVDILNGKDTVVHIAISGVAIPNVKLPSGIQSRVSHAPMAESALADSVIAQTTEPADLDGFADAYKTWRDACESEGAGYFTVSASHLIELYVKAMKMTGSA